jgi:N utilization substance protein B
VNNENDVIPATDDPRSEARLCVIQGVYQQRLTEDEPAQVKARMLKGRVAAGQAEKKLFAALYDATLADQDRFRTLVATHLREDWTFDRLDRTMQALLLVAVAELSTQPATSIKVVLSEYLTLTRAFFDEKQVAFVNGVLDQVAKQVRQ